MKAEQRFVCPRCEIENFSATGLHRHNCRGRDGTADRRRLTLLEISTALPVAAPKEIKNQVTERSDSSASKIENSP